MLKNILKFRQPYDDDSTQPIFIKVINTLVLLVYAAYLILSFAKFVSDSTQINTVLIFLVLECILIVIMLFKAIYYLRFCPIYSVLSILMFVLSVLYYGLRPEWTPALFLSTLCYYTILVLLVSCMYGINFDIIVRIFFLTIGSMFIIRVAGALTGILPTVKLSYKNVRENINTLGFGHYNVVLTYYLYICMALAYILKRRAHKIIAGIVMIFGALLLYSCTTSRTGTILSCLIGLGLIMFSLADKPFFSKYQNTFLSIFRRIMVIMPAFMVVFSFVLTLLCNYLKSYDIYNPGPFKTFMMRFKMLSEDFALHGIRLPWEWVNPDKIGTNDYSFIFGGVTATKYCDCFTHYVIINDGFLIYLVMIILFQIWAIRAYKSKDNTSLLIIGCIALYSFMESAAKYYNWNPFLLLLFSSEACKVRTNEDYIHPSLRRQLVNVCSAISEKIYFIVFFTFLYLFAALTIFPIAAYQHLTNLTTDYFYMWMIATVYYILIMYLILKESRLTSHADYSLTVLLRKYLAELIISVLILLGGGIYMAHYVYTTPQYTIDIDDPRLGDGYEVISGSSYRQVFNPHKAGIMKISIRLADYSSNVYSLTTAFTTGDGGSGFAKTFYCPAYADEGVIDIDTSKGAFAKDTPCALYFACSNKSDFYINPVITGVSYSFAGDFSMTDCLMKICVIMMVFTLVWIISSLLRLIIFNLKSANN